MTTPEPYRVTLNGRNYRVADFRNDWTIEHDEHLADILDPILEQIAEMLDPANNRTKLAFNLRVVYTMLKKEKRHREVLSMLFFPENGELSKEDHWADMVKLTHGDIEEAFLRFFDSVKRFGQGGFLTSLGLKVETDTTTTEAETTTTETAQILNI